MISNYDVVKEAYAIIKEQKELIEQQERDNLFLIVVLGATIVLMFLDAAWR